MFFNKTLQNCCTVPKKQIKTNKKTINCCTVPKKNKNPRFQDDVGGLLAWLAGLAGLVGWAGLTGWVGLAGCPGWLAGLAWRMPKPAQKTNENLSKTCAFQ